MTMYSKLLLSAIVLASLTASSFAQVIYLGKSQPLVGKIVDPKKFSPQIDTTRQPRRAERDHEMNFKLPAGIPNNLVTGGVLDSSRISVANGALFAGQGENGAEPPDPDIAVGPNHVIGVVNSSIAFYTKSGTKLFEQGIANFFKAVNPDPLVSDPKVIFDQVANRFVVIDLSINISSSAGVSFVMVAVSNSADPTGTWKAYKVDVAQTVGSNKYWMDYPGLGYNKDMIAVSGNMFAQTGSTGFNGVEIAVLDKAALYNGTAVVDRFSVPDGATCQLGKTEDATSPALYGVESFSQTSMRLTAITKVGASFTISQALVAVPKWNYDNGSLTGPGGIRVQTNDPRMLVTSAANGRIVSSHSCAVSSSDGNTAARWYDFKTNGWPASGLPTLNQSGQLNPPAGHGYSFPAIQIDGAGNIGMTFSMIGTSTPGKVMGTGRKVSDPAGTMGIPIVLENSLAGTYNGFSTRWGDYFDLERDPSDPRLFWAVGMGAGGNGLWETFIKSFKIAVVDADLIPVNAAGVTAVAGTIISGDKTSLSSADNVNLAIQSQAVRGLGQVAGFNAVYNLPFTGSVDTLRAFLKAAGPTGASALVSFKNIKTGMFDQVTTFGVNPTGTSKTIDLSPDQVALYVSSSSSVSMIIRCVNPSRSGVSPAAFTFNTDQASFGTLPKS
jgi:hypothetical protein